MGTRENPGPVAALNRIAVDKHSGMPAYVQIADGIAALLRGGALPAGTLLPPERVLSEQYDVSRMTLRQAMGVLERDGLIESHRGRGTFVAPRKIQKQEQEFRSFTEEIRRRGGKPESKLLSLKLVSPGAQAVEFFGLEKTDKVYELSRLRLKDGDPLAVELVHIPQCHVPALERFDLARNSLYQILEESYGLRLESSIEEISAELASAKHRDLLKLPARAAVLVVYRKTFTDTGAPLELGRSTYRGDLYSAVVHSVRKRKR
jgi:GntR family transcriptional regulator